MEGCRAESERIRCNRAALISNWRKQEIIRRKEEASYIGDNIGKCNHRITGLCSRRKHLFYRDNQSSRIISLPERDQKRGQKQIRKKNTDKIIWTGGESGNRYTGVLTTWKGLVICCILWMWYIFILTRKLNSILIRVKKTQAEKSWDTIMKENHLLKRKSLGYNKKKLQCIILDTGSSQKKKRWVLARSM